MSFYLSRFGMRLNKEGTGRWPFIRTSLQDPRDGMDQLGHDLTEGPGRPNGVHKVQGPLPPSTGSPVGGVGPTIGEVHDLQTALRESILAAPQGRPGLAPDSVGCPGRDLAKRFSSEWVGAFGRTPPPIFLVEYPPPLGPFGFFPPVSETSLTGPFRVQSGFEFLFLGSPRPPPPSPGCGILLTITLRGWPQAPPFSSTIQSRRRPSALPRSPPPRGPLPASRTSRRWRSASPPLRSPPTALASVSPPKGCDPPG